MSAQAENYISKHWHIFAGLIAITLGLFCNEWVIASLFSFDGYIDDAWQWLLIWLFDVVMILLGIFIFKFKTVLFTIPGIAEFGKFTGRSFAFVSINLIVASILLFGLLEAFPSLINQFGFSEIHYFGLKESYIADENLVFRPRPDREIKGQYYGDIYKEAYGIDVEPWDFEVSYDANGFRNDSLQYASDIVVLGDSYIEAGENSLDTFSKRLERNSSMKTINLGVAFYGPFHYLNVFKEYGIKQKPGFALFCFFEGNDIDDTKQFLKWKANGKYYHYDQTSKNIFQRYVMAYNDILNFSREMAGLVNINNWQEIQSDNPDRIHPELVVLEQGFKTAFFYRNEKTSPSELLRQDEWQKIESILAEFKQLAQQNNIVPIIVFIPTKTHIYASYSTDESGENWLEIRDIEIESSDNLESAFLTITRKIDLKMISLTPVFSEAALQGKFVYYEFDSHWNPEGRELAAAYIAEKLKSYQYENSTH